MNRRKKSIARTVALVIAAIMIVTTVMMGLPMVYGASGSRVYAAAGDVTDEQTLKEELDFMAKLMEALRRIYKDEVSYETLVNGAYQGMFEALGDPYSVYYDTKEESDALEEQLSGEFDGVGLSLTLSSGLCTVVTPVAGSPAEAAGLKQGDIITAVDGKSLSGMTLSECVALIRGTAGTKVRLTVRRGTTTMEFTVTRERIRKESVTWKMLENNVAYVQITQFDNDSDAEFRRTLSAIKEQGAKSMILDLRNNPGGYVNAATDIVNMLIPEKGKIIMGMNRQGENLQTVETTGRGKNFDLPLVVLVNGGSASASEIVAGALQDLDAATLVGAATYGKGIAQTVTGLKNGGTMKVSTYYFTTPKGNRIHEIGISPDVYVVNSVSEDQKEIAVKYAQLAPMTEKIKYYSGQTGLNVYGAQQRLNLLGEQLKLTGTMDEATVEAVKKFQKEAGMSPYGGLDYGTMATLERAVGQLLDADAEDAQLAKAIELLSK